MTENVLSIPVFRGLKHFLFLYCVIKKKLWLKLVFFKLLLWPLRILVIPKFGSCFSRLSAARKISVSLLLTESAPSACNWVVHATGNNIVSCC